MVVLDDCKSYLQEICCRYKQWWSENALTEAIAARQATFSFEQMVQTEEKDSEGKPRKTPPLPIFQAIQNYIESEHILLVGSPGVGKSTALLRYLVQVAERERGKPEPRIPVLVSLKKYKASFSNSEDPSGMLALIRNALPPKIRPRVDLPEVEELLFDKRLILFLDGLNEISAGTVRTHLKAFCEECQYSQVPLICTTRELGSGDLGIKRKLEIQPLESQEIERFLQECIPEQKQKTSQLLNRDKRELSRTPFVLWMLYDLFQKQGTEVETLAEAFRKFFRSFNKDYKEDVPVTDERRKDWNSWLKHLAFSMLDTSDPNDPGLIISREQAKQVLADQFGKHSDDLPRVDELLKYHVLESISDEEISFQHQLIQEYYAAEALLERLQRYPEWLEKTPEQEWTRFQQDYLNYLKWTEAIALMLGFPAITKGMVIQVVKLALEIDLMLGARLAGQVISKYQENCVALVDDLKLSMVFNGFFVKRKHFVEVPGWLKIKLLEETKSVAAFYLLRKLLKNSDSSIRAQAAYALGRLGDKNAEPELIKLLQDPDFYVRHAADRALWSIASEAVAPKDFFRAIPKLLALRNSFTRNSKKENDEELNNNERIQWLANLQEQLKSPEPEIRQYAVFELQQQGFRETLPQLLEMVGDPSAEVRRQVATAIGKLGNESVAPELLSMIDDSDLNVIANTCETLGELGNKIATLKLVQVLKQNQASWIRRLAAEALGKLSDEMAIPHLVQSLQKDESFRVRWKSAISLANLGRHEPIPFLLDGLSDPSRDVCIEAIKSLAKLKSPKTIAPILQSLKDLDPVVRDEATKIINEIGDKRVIPEVVGFLEDSNPNISWTAVNVLKGFDTSLTIELLPKLVDLLPSDVGIQAFNLLTNIQSRCKFYNYDIAQAKPSQSLEGRTGKDLIYYKLDTLTQEVKKVSEEPKRVIHTHNYFEEGTHTHTHNYANDEILKQEITDLRQLVSQLQQNHQPKTEAEAIQVLHTEFQKQKTNPNRWQATRRQLHLLKRQLLNPERHLTASKAAIAEIAKHYLEDNVLAKALITYVDTMSADNDQGE